LKIDPAFANDPTAKTLILGATIAVETLFQKKGGVAAVGGGGSDDD